ncbi:hypothetical protein KM043_001886 [Ampulex compressa]|nr:hypothetical protein KM043_001886 [Ampulex compressa]
MLSLYNVTFTRHNFTYYKVELRLEDLIDHNGYTVQGFEGTSTLQAINRYNMSTMLSNDAQLRYVVEWFREWSEMQRNDFLEVLMERCGPPGLVNGLVSGMETLGYAQDTDRPPSLFQCRVKLFREWSYNWSQQEKDSLLSSIKNIDSAFANKYEQKLSTWINKEKSS